MNAMANLIHCHHPSSWQLEGVEAWRKYSDEGEDGIDGMMNEQMSRWRAIQKFSMTPRSDESCQQIGERGGKVSVDFCKGFFSSRCFLRPSL